MRFKARGFFRLVDRTAAGEHQAERARVTVSNARPAERPLVVLDGADDRLTAAVENVVTAPDVRTNAVRIAFSGDCPASSALRVARSPVTYSEVTIIASAGGEARAGAAAPATSSAVRNAVK
jgi:hypothetical protein